MDNNLYTKSKTALSDIIKEYEYLTRGIDGHARTGEKKRAYGGIIRAGKGKLVENIAERIVKNAWASLGGSLTRLSSNRQTVKIPIKKDYVEKIKDPNVKKFIMDNLNKYYYPLSTDLHIHIDNNFVLAIECKSYTENAMFKRILVDFTLLKQIYPQLNFVLFQLESQLGGDYSAMKQTTFGSHSTHTLLSHFDIDLHIITLLEGERKVDRPIHKADFYKPLKRENLQKATDIIADLLKAYI